MLFTGSFHGFLWYFVLFSVTDASRMGDYGNHAKTLESQNDKNQQQHAPASQTTRIKNAYR